MAAFDGPRVVLFGLNDEGVMVPFRVDDDGRLQLTSGGGITDHGLLDGLVDNDHTQYQLRTEKGVVSGYAALDTDIKVPATQLGGVGADATKYLRGDRTWETFPTLITDHGALAGLTDDDHTQYLLADGSRDVNGSLRIIHPAAATVAALRITTSDLTENALEIRPESPGAIPESWQPNTYINAVGAYYTGAWITVSGTPGHVHPSADPYGIGIWTDVEGPALQLRSPEFEFESGSYLISGLNRDGTYTFAVENDGKLQWGATTRVGMDTNLYRGAANQLRTDDSLRVGGQVLLADGSAAAPGVAFALDTNTGFYRITDDSIGIVLSGALACYWNLDGPSILAGSSGEFIRAGAVPAAPDIKLNRDGAGIINQRNGAVAQEFRVSETDNNFGINSRLRFQATAGDFKIFPESNGGATLRGLQLVASGGRLGFFGVTAVARAAAYTPTNVVADRAYDADATDVAELADVVGTLIADLQAYGLLQ